MKPSPDEILSRFASRLSCSYTCETRTPYAPSASTLPHFLSSSSTSSDAQGDGGGHCCSFPCLSLRRRRGEQSFSPSSILDKEEAAQYLGRVLRVGPHALALAPPTLLRNVLWSFGHTLEASLQRAICTLVEKQDAVTAERERRTNRGREGGRTEKKRSPNVASLALTAFSSSQASPIAPVAAVTNFYTVPRSSEGRRRHKGHSRHTHNHHPDSGAHNHSSNNPSGTTDERRQKQPAHRHEIKLVFEVSIDVALFGKQVVTADVRAPGTVSGVFTTQRNHPDAVEITIDTAAFMKAMRKECRDIVRQAVIVATGRKAKPGSGTNSNGNEGRGGSSTPPIPPQDPLEDSLTPSSKPHAGSTKSNNKAAVHKKDGPPANLSRNKSVTTKRSRDSPQDSPPGSHSSVGEANTVGVSQSDDTQPMSSLSLNGNSNSLSKLSPNPRVPKKSKEKASSSSSGGSGASSNNSSNSSSSARRVFRRGLSELRDQGLPQIPHADSQ